MGFGGSIKKAVKSVVKASSSPKGFAGIVAAPLTGGASLALTGSEYTSQEKKEKQQEAYEEEKRAEQQEIVQEQEAELERKRKKMEELAGREQSRVSGIGSLISRNNMTLG